MLPLEDIRVVALEQAVAAPLCTRHLADLGADVVKIERPGGGDLARRYDSIVKGQSTYFVWLNRNKRSIALDLAKPEDRDVCIALLARADVFVHNLGPGAVDRLGLGWETLHARWPRLISCAISGYGSEGPYRDRKAYDLLIQAETAVTDVTGTAGSPAKVGISIADIGAGLYACTSILAALRLRDADGEGRRIDVSLFDCLAEWMTVPAYHQIYDGKPPPRSGVRHATIVPYGPYRCADGEVMLAVQNEGQWDRLCRNVLRRPALAEDPRAARLLGVDVERAIAATFFISAGLGGVAGVLYGFATNSPYSQMGLPFELKAFTVMVVGGMGSIPGALVGAYLLSFGESASLAFLPSELRDAFAFGLLFIVLLVRPNGLLGAKPADRV
jgi:crotonobetainyl-CoA:carnitine CoA-transferase CaiB-like acyl-CoA transferase